MIPWAKPNYYGYEKKYINQALQSTWLSEGKFVKDLENKVCKFVNSKFAISVTSCTSALHLALDAFGVGKGDEVMIPALTVAMCGYAVWQCGATPVFVDVRN